MSCHGRSITKSGDTMSFYDHKGNRAKSGKILGLTIALLRQEQMPQNPEDLCAAYFLHLEAGLHVGHPEGYGDS